MISDWPIYMVVFQPMAEADKRARANALGKQIHAVVIIVMHMQGRRQNKISGDGSYSAPKARSEALEAPRA